MPSVNKVSLVSSSVIGITFLSFFYLIELAKTSSTMLNMSGKKGYSCLGSESVRVKQLVCWH